MSKIFTNDKISMSDEELVRLVINSDESAFKVLYDRYLPKIRTMTYSFQGLGYDIDDLVQEATIGFFTAINVYDHKSSSFSTFCYVCMRRMLIALLRKNGRKKNISDSIIIHSDENFFDLPDSGNPETDYIAQEDFERLKTRIEKELSKTEREVLYCYLSGWDYGQIASNLKLTKKSVDNALQRIRCKLR